MKLLSILLALLIATTACFAYGVSPAKKVIDTPGEHTFTIIARHAGEKGIVTIRAEGDLAHAIAFDRTSAQFTGDVTFSGTILIPSDIAPGDHEQKIIVSVASSENGVMTAAVETASLLTIRKSYPGAYLVADVHAAPDEGKDATNIYISIENRGDTAVMPKVSLERPLSEVAVPSITIAPRETVQLKAELLGRGEENITLIISGANELRKQFTARIGHPIITSLSAQANPDSGNITPIIVKAEVDWNVPVSATVTLDGKSTVIVIDKSHTGTYYTETNATIAKLELRVGSDVRTADVDLAGASFDDMTLLGFRWEWIALVLLLGLLAFVLYRKFRSV